MFKVATLYVDEEMLDFLETTQKRFGKTREEILLGAMSIYRHAIEKEELGYDCFWIKKGNEDILEIISDINPEELGIMPSIRGIFSIDEMLAEPPDPNKVQYKTVEVIIHKKLFNKYLFSKILMRIGVWIFLLGRKTSKEAKERSLQFLEVQQKGKIDVRT